MWPTLNLKIWHSGRFEINKRKTAYVGGVLFMTDKLSDFTFAYVTQRIIRDILGIREPVCIFFRRRGLSLHNGLKEFKDDSVVKEILETKDANDFVTLFLVPKEGSSVVFEGNASGPDVPCDDDDMEVVNADQDDSLDDFGLEFLISDDWLLQDPTLQSSLGPSNMHMNPSVKASNAPKHSLQSSHQNTSLSKLPLRRNVSSVVNPSDEGFRSDPHSDGTESDTSWSDDADSDADYQGDADLSDEDFENDEGADFFSEDVARGLLNSVNGRRISDSIRQGSVPDRVQSVIVDEHLNEDSGEEGSLIRSDEDVDDYPVFNPSVDFKKRIELLIGLKFPTVEVFRKALKHHAIENRYDYYALHNNCKRFQGYCRYKCKCTWQSGKGKYMRCVCKVENKCPFRIYACKLKLEDTFQIKSLNLTHNCVRMNTNTKMSSEYLAERYLHEWRDDPKWSLNQLKKKMMHELGIKIKYHIGYYAKQKALQIIYGSAREEYSSVWDYVEAIKRYNPGSSGFVVMSNIERPPPLFQRMYVCLQPCKEGFVAGCRPILGVDGTHLRGVFPGCCLVAVGKDGNNNLYPLAYAVVEAENKDSWSWFLHLLTEDLGSVTQSLIWVGKGDGELNVTYMSDRQKGLLDAFARVVPNAEIRFCYRHIWANFKLAFPGEAYKELFWMAARSSTKVEFTKHMLEIKRLSTHAYDYLAKIPTMHWSRHAFSTRSKSAMVLNNCCESFNNVIKEAREMPILSMMEWIRRYIMQRMMAKKEGMSTYTEKIMPSVIKQLEMAYVQSRKCDFIQVAVDEFEVQHYEYRHVVNLKEMRCGCFKWELSGIPCTHVVACIVDKRLDPKDFVHVAYTKEMYLKTYSPTCHAMPSRDQWQITPHPRPDPPPFKIMPGRPKKKNRKKEVGEEQSRAKHQVKRKRLPNKCGKCGLYGHNKRKCTNAAAPTSEPIIGRPRKNTEPRGKKTTTKEQQSNAIPTWMRKKRRYSAMLSSSVSEAMSQDVPQSQIPSFTQ